MIGSAGLLKNDETNIHPLYHQSATLTRFVRATYQADTYQVHLGVEHVDVLRAAIADMFGHLDRADWERSASAFCQNVWLTDCNSTSTSLLRPVMGNITDRRLAIEVAALRQSLWRRPGQPLEDDSVEDERPPEDQAADVIRWIDTDIMLVDPLTKAMSAEKLYASRRDARV